MTEPPLPEFLIVGPQKCATTWLYDCLYDHPDVLMPETDSVQYFDMNYQREEQWYRGHFTQYDGESVVGEETASYIRSEMAPKRIAETIPDAKLIFILRNPIDRAFSHWWHEKSKNKHSFDFEEVLENFDLYQNWIVPGLYHRHLMRFSEYFPEEQIKICFFDDLVENDKQYVQDVYSFLDINDEYIPSLINQKVNQGRFRGIGQTFVYNIIVSTYKKIAPKPAIEAVRPLHRRIRKSLASRTEYEEGMDEDIRERLEERFVNDIRDLSDYTGRDLAHWLQYHDI